MSDAHPAAIADRNPARPLSGVEQGAQDRPVGDRIAAIEQPLGLARRRRHRRGIHVVATERDGADLARAHELVDRQRNRVALPESQPADARRQSLRPHSPAGQRDPPRQRRRANDVDHRVLGPPQVLGVAGEVDPAKRADAPRQDRAHVRGHEPRYLHRLGHARVPGLGAEVVAVLEHDRPTLAQRQHRGHVRGDRGPDLAEVGLIAGDGRPRPLDGVARRDVTPEQVVGSGLIGDHVEVHAVCDQPGDHLGGVADQPDRGGTIRVVERGHGVAVVVGDQLDPVALDAALGASRIDLDDQRPPAVELDRQPLGTPHPAESGGEHASALQGPVEVRASDGGKRLVGEPEYALGADVEPPAGSHLAVHRQPGGLQRPEVLRSRPVGHEHRARDQDPRRIGVRRQHRHRLARLHDQRLGAAQVPQGGDDRVQRAPVARRLSLAAVDDELLGPLGHLGIEVVKQAAQRALLLPTPAADRAAAGPRDLTRCRWTGHALGLRSTGLLSPSVSGSTGSNSLTRAPTSSSRSSVSPLPTATWARASASSSAR